MELNSNPEVPQKFPKLPRKFGKLPRKFPDFPGGQPFSLGSLTPSPDSQKLSLKRGEAFSEFEVWKGFPQERQFSEEVRPFSEPPGSEEESGLLKKEVTIFKGVAARWGDPACGMSMLLDPVQFEEHHEPGPPTPFEPEPPFRPGTPPSCTAL